MRTGPVTLTERLVPVIAEIKALLADALVAVDQIDSLGEQPMKRDPLPLAAPAALTARIVDLEAEMEALSTEKLTLEQQVSFLEAELQVAARRINGMEALLEAMEPSLRQEQALLERAVAENDRLRQELMTATQQKLPLDE